MNTTAKNKLNVNDDKSKLLLNRLSLLYGVMAFPNLYEYDNTGAALRRP